MVIPRDNSIENLVGIRDVKAKVLGCTSKGVARRNQETKNSQPRVHFRRRTQTNAKVPKESKTQGAGSGTGMFEK